MNIGRNIMWYIKVFGGMGSSEAGLPRDIWPLSLDKEDEKQMITNIKMANDLLLEF